MRLSTERDRDESRALAVLHAAFEAGVTLVDTADAYCWDASEVGHNERLIARALATWKGDRSRIRVATKGGLTRPRGTWVPDGRAKHLVLACEASRRALDVERIALYQLHAPDPRTPLSTSVRALASLKRDGRIEAIGLCNVTVGQIEEARRITEIAAVQVELSVWQTAGIMSGVAEYCCANGIQLLAHRPLGGVRNRRRTLSDRTLTDLAARHDATPFEIALAWLGDLSNALVPLPGPTRIETAQSLARARQIVLSEDDRARLDEKVPAGRRLRLRERVAAPEHPTDGEVVLIMGLPAAGKSTVAQSFVAQGYERLNRDEAGGTLADLLPTLDRHLSSGSSRLVLDNTYISRASRAAVIEGARARGLPVRCVWLTTSVEDAQVNAASRESTAFAPTVQFRYQRQLEPPELSEGFSRVDVTPFERRHDPSLVNRALILWCDGVLRRSRSGHRSPISVDDVEVFAERREMLAGYQAEGWRLLALSWQPEITENGVTVDDIHARFVRMQQLLGLEIEVEYCPHGGGPPHCWCRKPMPGLGVLFIRRHRLDPSKCMYVGAGPQDAGFARRLGFQYRDAADFFRRPAVPVETTVQSRGS